MNVQGVVKYVYDNRLTKDGTPNKFPNFKFKVNDQEIVLWSAIKPIFLEKGKKVSVTCQASKKNGSLFVQSKEDKSPMMQELPADNKPDTSFNPEELEQELVQAAKEFDADLRIETKKPINKDEYMFVMALAKSAIESGKINVNKEEIDLLIKDLKFLFQINFHN
jgi:phosphotransferase system HPr-like phosphotransfer protein